MSLYRIKERRNGYPLLLPEVEASSPEAACKKLGLAVGDCFIRVRTPRVKNLKTESGWSGGGWRNVTTEELYCRHLLDGNCTVPGYNFHDSKKCSSLLNEACMAKGGRQK